jgi:GT2 family glycosyltransferase
MNSDVDPTEQINSHQFPNTTVLRSNANLGFSGGNNWGIRQAKGDFIFIVNNDTEVTPDLLDQLLAPFSKDPLIGVTCPKIRFFNQPAIIQYAGFKPMNILTGRTAAAGNLEEDKGQHDVSGYTAGAHGCAMMVKKEVIEKTGMFPENFFLYYEEWDWSYRIIKAGFRIFYQASALIYHKESMTVGKQNPAKVYYLTRNRILFMRRNTKLHQFIFFICFFTLFTVPKSVIGYVSKKQFGFLKKFFKGAFDGITISKYSLVH